MSKNFIIPLHIYPFDVMVSIGETDEGLCKVLKKHLPDNCHDEIEKTKYAENGRGKLVRFSCGAICIRVKQAKTPNDYGSLQHEIFHAVEYLMDKIGVKYSVDCGEVYAYAIGYLTEEIYKRL